MLELRDVIVSVAAFGGALLWQVSPRVNLLTAFAFGVLGTAWFAWRGRDLDAARSSRVSTLRPAGESLQAR